MTIARKPLYTDEIRQSASHVLFVEGSGQDAIDHLAISSLLDDKIKIEPLGPSYHIRSAAEALHRYHPDYYFLIDRDHYDDRFVNRCWENFPDPGTPNLLIWHRREIENYFLIPEYIAKSKFISVSADQIKDEIMRHCRDRLYIDAANQVIISIREDLKKNWIELFSDPVEFKTKESAIAKLTGAKEFIECEKKVCRSVQKEELTRRFEEILSDITGDKEPIEYGSGQWLERLRGKKILPTLINKYFQVKDARGASLKGKEKMKEVIRELLKKPVQEQPDDFQKLREVIFKRIESA